MANLVANGDLSASSCTLVDGRPKEAEGGVDTSITTFVLNGLLGRRKRDVDGVLAKRRTFGVLSLSEPGVHGLEASPASESLTAGVDGCVLRMDGEAVTDVAASCSPVPIVRSAVSCQSVTQPLLLAGPAMCYFATNRKLLKNHV